MLFHATGDALGICVFRVGDALFSKLSGNGSAGAGAAGGVGGAVASGGVFGAEFDGAGVADTARGVCGAGGGVSAV